MTHTTNIETMSNGGMAYRAWCPCGFQGEWTPVEDEAQEDAYWHVEDPEEPQPEDEVDGWAASYNPSTGQYDSLEWGI